MHNKKLIYVSFIICGLLNSAVFAESVYSQVDERLLLNPDPLQVKQETAGKVIIYERVREQTINKAMDDSFARIDNMMFVKTVIKEENGEFDTEDDDCD